MAGKGNIIQRILRLTFDRRSAMKAQADSKKTVGGIDRALGTIKKSALAAGGAIAAAFAFKKIIQGVKDLTRASLEQERGQKRLAATLQTVGVNYESVEGAIDASARALQDITTFGDTEFRDALQRMVSISGDFQGSLENVELAMDVAAGTQRDLASAARYVGLAMIGETGQLKELGIVVDDTLGPIESMRRQFSGLAEGEAKSFGGRLDQLRNETGDLKEALGDFVTQSDVAQGVIGFLTSRIKDATEAIRELQETDAETAARVAASAVQQATPDQLIRTRDRLRAEQEELVLRWARIVGAGESAALDIVQNRLGVVSAQVHEIEQEMARRQILPGIEVSLENAVKAASEREKAFQAEIQSLTRLSELGLLTEDEKQRVLELERQLSREIAAGIPDLERRLAIAQQLAGLSAAASGIRAEGISTVGAGRTIPPPGLAAPSVPPGLGVVRLSSQEAAAIERRKELQAIAAQEMLDNLARMEMAAQRTAAVMTDAFSTFFETLITDSQNAGGALVAALLEGLARYLDIRASAAFAEGLLGNPAGFAAGVAFAAAAGAARALEGQLAGNARNSASGGASLSTGAGRTGSSRTPTTRDPEITLVLQGDFDALNPKFVRAVYSAQTEGIQTIGEGNVRIRTMPRGGG